MTAFLGDTTSERFYTRSLLQIGPVELDGDEAHHLGVVCRLRAGDLVCLFNGDGCQYPARIQAVSKRSVSLEVLSQEAPARELSFALTVAAPVPKGDRAQFLVEKLTELGVTTYVPLATQHSVIQPREAKLEKLQRYVIEASKQCGRNVLMKVESLASWDDFCKRDDLGPVRLVAHPNQELPGTWKQQVSAGSSIALAVGPEGGFTDAEIDRAGAAGWQAVGLGPRILRVETAALALTAWVIAFHA